MSDYQDVLAPSPEEVLGTTPSAPAVKFPTIGTKFTGVVLDQQTQQQREWTPEGPGAPKTWPDGKPMWQVVLTCVDDESGEEVRLYLKSGLLKAAKGALRANKMTTFPAGTRVSVEFVAQGANNAKEYSVGITPGMPPEPGEVSKPKVVTPRTEHSTTVEEDRVALKAKLEGKPTEAEQVAPESGLTPDQLAALKAAGLV